MFGYQQFVGQNDGASKLRIFYPFDTFANLSTANIPKVE